MITPIGVTLADYIAAVKADEPTHIRITFIGQNVVLDDSDIDSSGIVVNDYLNGDTDLIMGKAVMKNIRIPIIRSAKLNGLIWNGEFTVEIGQEVNGTTNWITYGYFTGSRPEKINSVDVIEFTANDRMALFDRLAAPWIASLTYPKTVKQLFQSLCTFCGAGYENGDELANMANKAYGSFPYQHEGQTCREVLAQIAEACGCYAKITPNGNGKLVWYTDHTSDYTVTENDVFPSVEIYEYSEGKTWAELENYKWEDLEHFRWCDLSGTKALFKVDVLNMVDTVRGNSINYPSDISGNTYVIIDNPFIEFDTSIKIYNYVRPIYNRLVAFGGYLPLKAKCLGNALIESGDIVNIVVNGVTHNLPIFCKQFSWNGALVDYYEATGQINRAEVSADTTKHISENSKYYNRQSGIDILPEGIEIVGSKYVKIYSGGTFDVDSNNFKIDSVAKIIRVDDFGIDRFGFFGDRTFIVNGEQQPTKWHVGYNNYEHFSDIPYLSIVAIPNNITGSNGGEFQFSIQDGEGYKEKIIVFRKIKDSDKIMIGAMEVEPASGGGALISQCKGTLGYDPGPYHITTGCWDVYGANVYYNYLISNSSRDVKHDIHDIPSEGDRIDKLRPVTFIYNEDEHNRKRYGLIYEETIEVMPEITTQDDNNKAISYIELVPVLLKETQELRKRVSDLEKRVAKLEGRG